VVDGVKVRGNISLNDPEVFPYFGGIRVRFRNSIHRPPEWTESEGRLTEISLKERFQDHSRRFLYNPVPNGRDAQRASLSVGFRNVHPSDWVRLKRFRL
jgi:hypothetical protein